MSGSQTFKNNSRRAQGGNWRPSRKCVGKCRWCDCESPGRPEGTVAQPAKISSAFLKPALSQEKILPTETNARTTPAPNWEMRNVKHKEGLPVTSVDQKNMLFNVSGFRRTNANGIQRKANIYFRLVFWLTVEELGDEAEPWFLSDSLVASEMFPKGETLPNLDTWPVFDRQNMTEHQSSDSSPLGTECHFLCKF